MSAFFSLNRLAASVALACVALSPAFTAHAQQAFPATLAGHAVMPALTVIPAPADAPADLRHAGKFTTAQRVEKLGAVMGLSAGRPTGISLPFDGQPVQGHSGIKRDSPDFFAATILNEILGGGRFSARLMTEVREKRGLTYGIGTGLASYDHAEALVGQLAAGNENVAPAIEVIRAEWAKIAAEGITEAELVATKTFLTGAYPLRFDGNDTIASILVGMQIMGLDTDYPKTRNARVEAVTMADIKRVAARLFKPDDLFFVVVGEPTGVTSTE